MRAYYVCVSGSNTALPKKNSKIKTNKQQMFNARYQSFDKNLKATLLIIWGGQFYVFLRAFTQLRFISENGF
jgi:ABC-type Zn2+ transport system substrate-binding protein/surface adhesin